VSGHESERLSAYLDGELAPAERAAVEAHLAACPECAAFLAELSAADRAAAALPAEAPEGYFDTFPARVRARLQPRKAARPARRVPAWTWAAAAALFLAVITPLTLREARHAADEARPPAPTAAKTAPLTEEPNAAPEARAPRPTAAPQGGSRAVPPPPAALPLEVRATPRAAAATGEATPRERKDQPTVNAFAREAPAPAERDEGVATGAPADLEPQGAVGGVAGGVVSQDAADREKRERVAPRAAVTAESASPMMSAAGAGHEATPASLKAQEDAVRRLEAVRPRTAAGWRRVREQWDALAAAETDPVRADEARVRAIVAAREAWRAGGDEGDAAAFRAGAESYLRRDDARQKPRVEGLLAEATARPSP
jgi:anti-sigma factor RsiW